MALLVDNIFQLIVVVLNILAGYSLVSVIYYRFFHPLAKYPGPFLASFTDLWQVYQFLTLKQPYYLTELHEKYGPVVRYGPDKVSITDEGAIPVLYQKGGRLFPKTEFYDAYGGRIPNVFGMRDEEKHSIRRRHMAHSFSSGSVKQMEEYLDININIVRDKLAQYSTSNQAFDLKKVLHYYVIDVLGELAFSQSFGVQTADDQSLVPPVVEHSLLAAATGAWPTMLPTLKRWLPKVPYKPLQKLFAGRQACIDLAVRCVAKRREELKFAPEGEKSSQQQRKDILTSLILARHPDTGDELPTVDIEAEAFGFIIAGTHTTSATTSLLFYHLLHAPDILSRCVTEIDTNLPPLPPPQAAYSVTDAEASLPYLRQCIKENFRITPVFTMPLARRVVAPDGVQIDSKHFPQGTSLAVCNHAFHHNAAVWGADHNVFAPERWDEPRTAERAKLLMHFGLGGRQCIGKNVATTNIIKVMSTLLREFEFELADERERADAAIGLYRGKIPSMLSVGISDLEMPLMVRVKARWAN